MTTRSTTLRPLNFRLDIKSLRHFVDDLDLKRIQKCENHMIESNSSIYVADNSDFLVGWIELHLMFPEGIGWARERQSIEMMTGTNGYLATIEVCESHRSCGIGQKLLDYAYDFFRSNKKETVWLHVRNDNERAKSLYERNDWKYSQTVHPEWKDRIAMDIYSKKLVIS